MTLKELKNISPQINPTKRTREWWQTETHLAFSAKRDGDEASRVYVIDVGGGAARLSTQLALGARAPQWSPDGKTIRFQASMHRGATNDAANKSSAEDQEAKTFTTFKRL